MFSQPTAFRVCIYLIVQCKVSHCSRGWIVVQHCTQRAYAHMHACIVADALMYIYASNLDVNMQVLQ